METIRGIVGDKQFEFTSDGKKVSREITISIGVSVFPQDSDDPEVIINKADQALYLAEAHGRNRVVSHQ